MLASSLHSPPIITRIINTHRWNSDFDRKVGGCTKPMYDVWADVLSLFYWYGGRDDVFSSSGRTHKEAIRNEWL
jgi:hypothetical protein